MSDSKNHMDASSSSRSAMYTNQLNQPKLELVSLTLFDTPANVAEFRRPLSAVANVAGMDALRCFIDAKVQAFDPDSDRHLECNSDDLAPFALNVVDITGRNIDLPDTKPHNPSYFSGGRSVCRFKMIVKNTTTIGMVETIIAYGWVDNNVPDERSVFTINSLHRVRDHHYLDDAGTRVVGKHFGEGMHLLSNPNYSGPCGDLVVQTPYNVAGMLNIHAFMPELSGISQVSVTDTRAWYNTGITFSEMSFENPINYLGKMTVAMFDAFAQQHVLNETDNVSLKNHAVMTNLLRAVSPQHPRSNSLLAAMAATATHLTPTFTLPQLSRIMAQDCKSALQFGVRKTNYPRVPDVWDNYEPSAFAFKIGMSFLGVMGRLGIEKLGYHYNNTEGTDVTKLKRGFCNEVVDLLGGVPETDKLLALSEELEVLCKVYTCNGELNLNLTINIDISNEAEITLTVGFNPVKFFVLPLFASALNSTMIASDDDYQNVAKVFGDVFDMVSDAFDRKPPFPIAMSPVPY